LNVSARPYSMSTNTRWTPAHWNPPKTSSTGARAACQRHAAGTTLQLPTPNNSASCCATSALTTATSSPLRPCLQMARTHHDAQRRIKGTRRVGQKGRHAPQRLVALGVEHMQDGAHQQSV